MQKLIGVLLLTITTFSGIQASELFLLSRTYDIESTNKSTKSITELANDLSWGIGGKIDLPANRFNKYGVTPYLEASFQYLRFKEITGKSLEEGSKNLFTYGFGFDIDIQGIVQLDLRFGLDRHLFLHNVTTTRFQIVEAYIFNESINAKRKIYTFDKNINIFANLGLTHYNSRSLEPFKVSNGWGFSPALSLVREDVSLQVYYQYHKQNTSLTRQRRDSIGVKGLFFF